MKQRISFLLACVFLCLSGCRASGAEQTFFAMDTVMSVQVSGRRGPQAVAAAREAVERLDDLLSRTDSDSQIARLNTAAGDGAVVAVDPDVAELLAFSQEIARQLPGDFDITIAPVMDAWGFTTEERHVPAPDALAAAMALVDSEELSVDTEASAASLARAGMEVDRAPWPRASRPGRPRRPSGMREGPPPCWIWAATSRSSAPRRTAPPGGWR